MKSRRSLGEYLDITFRVYRKNILILFSIFFVYSMLSTGIDALYRMPLLSSPESFTALKQNIENDYKGIRGKDKVTRLVVNPLKTILFSVGTVLKILKYLLLYVLLAVSVVYSMFVIDGSGKKLRSILTSALKKIPLFIFTSILYILAILGGFIFFIVPGFIIMFSGFFIFHIVLNNGKKPLRTSISYSYSRAAVVYPSFILIIFFIAIMYAALNFVQITAVARIVAIFPFLKSAAPLLRGMGSGIVFSLTIPLFIVHTSVLYLLLFKEQNATEYN